MNSLRLTDEEFNLISKLVYDKFGINLGEQKRALIIGRLQKVLHLEGFTSFKDYYNYVVRDPSGRALLTMVDKISTNHTFFFRENDHFEYFSSVVLPQLTTRQQRKPKIDIRVWCAGCSSGEEPYTLAMVISEYFRNNAVDADIGILATDISITALEKGAAGVYPEEKMAQVPFIYRQRYFDRSKDGSYTAKKELKEMVLFRRLNLIQQEYPFKGHFQVIFCRNVMIYFDKETQRSLIGRFYRYTEPGGYLFIGHSETLDRSLGTYNYIHPSVYQRA
ncbi:MAG: protein-glutamate O-methyltransferase CheR [Peptococcaceae bacterium]|nr:protein-glutamate O-methyltransferase CheR [Peptococcaceae bacterium]